MRNGTRMRIINSRIKIIIGKSSIEYTDEEELGIEAVLFNLFVHPEERGNKLGHKLIKIAIEEIKQRGYEKIFLVAKSKENIPDEILFKYYEKLGFYRVGDSNEMYLKESDMKNRSRKCGSCINFTKLNLYGICEIFDYKCYTDSSSCPYWKGSNIPKKIKYIDQKIKEEVIYIIKEE
jgi:N-acetylglutamate synthase-like GNAT family acetyltransferase